MTSLRHSLKLNKGGVISLVGAGGKTSLMFRLARELSRQGAAVLSTTTTKIYTPSRKQSSVVMVSESASALALEAREILRRNTHISAGSRLIHFQNKLKGFPPETIDAIWQSGLFRWIVVEADGAAGTEKWVFRPQLVSKITGLAQGASITESAIAAVLMNANGIMKGFPAQAKRFAFLNQAESPERLEAGRRIAEMICSHKATGFSGVLIGQTLFEPLVKAYYSAD
jgi:hypothetical protein